MKPEQLNILLQEGEGTLLEYKESLSASFARELVALANTLGGRILLGVRDDGTVVGIQDSNEKLSRNEIRDFFRSDGVIRFDLSINPRFQYPDDFDKDKFNAWIKLSNITSRPRIEDVLVNSEAAERSEGKLLFRNAGVLFFAKNVRHFFNQAYITCLLAKGTDKVHVLDRKDFDGGIVADIEDAMRFIERNTRTAYRIERLQRENIPEYPMKALREAITNAVMHRDWFVEGANVFVEIYTDRIEVSNPGGLPKGMTLEDLGRKSIRRNALIADLLHRIDFIEKAGTGIRRIRDDVREQGCPEPAFETNGFFTAIFRPNPEVRAQVGTNDIQLQHDRDHVPEQVAGQVAGQVTPEVLQMLKIASGEMTRVELQSALELKGRANFEERYLKPALNQRLVEMTIPDKPKSRLQKYRVTTLGRQILEKHRIRKEDKGKLS